MTAEASREAAGLSREARLLAMTELFAGLEPALLERLAEQARWRRYRRGELLCRQGEEGDSLMVVDQGLVKVFVTSELGDEMVLVTLRRPEAFGEVALLDGGPRSASCEAVVPTEVLVLTRRSLMGALEQQPALAAAMLRSLSRRLRRLTEQASDLVFLDLHGRVAKLLLALASDPQGSEERTLDLEITQTDLARMVGGSRQSVNQILHGFAARGYLTVRGRHITITRPDLLRRRAGG